MTAETPRIAQQTGSGMCSSSSRIEPVEAGAGVGVIGEIVAGNEPAARGATVTGALCTFGAGAVINGCVFVIFTAGAGAAGSGRMLMRAVSFFGPD